MACTPMCMCGSPPAAAWLSSLWSARGGGITFMHAGEDFAFCDRWRALGGEVWVDLTEGVNHVGSYKHLGRDWVERYKPGPGTGAATNSRASPAPATREETRAEL